ncbi:peptidoglycan/LPS O-acetylase OafA/YrhL [Arcanobacterium wilhelmae]|uniref:Peptidoglycan/LPS O-acetylase OafA/YrhL n=1 Tax=Arcanobacterium wilhelmae TaxID=1803177 RepID=A0ABT9ND78_9ACTO|nr:acyltransferase [Arcanobacterium wilhelmae]MDP9801674.1 peptidoglycan/LPS O-acetylase OafA/YrhL [Arcanobacterium wilhelmae]WFN90995.1 acyltransferase [Arcanobacterium wilhelmae]
MPKPIGHSSRYNPAIDGIRTLAVLAVIFYHMKLAWMPGGLLGVAVFFTISGFLITGNLMRSWYRHGNLGLKTFWLRRLRRLMPAVILVVLVVWALTPFLAANKWADYRFGGLTAIFYVNNWASIVYGDSYFDQFEASPLEHMWSLSVEEQFYVFWPLVLFLFLVLARGRKATVVALTMVLAAASFGWMAYAHSLGYEATRIYEGTDTRAGSLLIGAVLAMLVTRRSAENGEETTSGRLFAEIAGLAGVAVVVGMMLRTDDNASYLYTYGLVLVGIASAGLLYGVSHQRTLVGRFLGSHQLPGWGSVATRFICGTCR